MDSLARVPREQPPAGRATPAPPTSLALDDGGLSPELRRAFAVLNRGRGREYRAVPEKSRRRGRLTGLLSALPGRITDEMALRVGERLFLFSDPPDCSGDVPGRIRWHRRLYGDPGLLAHPGRFYRPPAPPREVNLRPLGRLRGGERLALTFQSPYRTFDPDFHWAYQQFRRNRTAHARLWLQRRPGRPTLVFVNPWCCGQLWLEERLFDARGFFRRGYNVALFAMPFHGPRTPARAIYSGQLFPNRELRRTNEGFGQAVCDLRALIGWLRRERGVGPVGLAGMSLGGYTTALMAALEPDLSCAVVIMAPCSLADGLWFHGQSSGAKRQAEQAGFTLDDFRTIWAIHTPIVLPRKVPRERTLLVWAQSDRLIPGLHHRALWEHWGRPETLRVPGSHLWQSGRPAWLSGLRSWLRRRF